MADQGREDDERGQAELPLGDPQINLPPSEISSSQTPSVPTTDKKSGYYSGRGYRDLKDLPRHERRRIEREIRKGRKPGESCDCSHDNY